MTSRVCRLAPIYSKHRPHQKAGHEGLRDGTMKCVFRTASQHTRTDSCGQALWHHERKSDGLALFLRSRSTPKNERLLVVTRPKRHGPVFPCRSALFVIQGTPKFRTKVNEKYRSKFHVVRVIYTWNSCDVFFNSSFLCGEGGGGGGGGYRTRS